MNYLHLAKWDGEWLVVNVLWELTPKALTVAAARDAASDIVAERHFRS